MRIRANRDGPRASRSHGIARALGRIAELRDSGHAALPRGGARSSARPWSPEEAAEFAARRDFRFVQLLSTDRDAFRVHGSPPRDVCRAFHCGPQ